MPKRHYKYSGRKKLTKRPKVGDYVAWGDKEMRVAKVVGWVVKDPSRIFVSGFPGTYSLQAFYKPTNAEVVAARLLGRLV